MTPSSHDENETIELPLWLAIVLGSAAIAAIAIAILSFPATANTSNIGIGFDLNVTCPPVEQFCGEEGMIHYGQEQSHFPFAPIRRNIFDCRTASGEIHSNAIDLESDMWTIGNRSYPVVFNNCGEASS